MNNKQLAELISRLSKVLEITALTMSILFFVFTYQAGILPQTIKIGAIILCSTCIFGITGRIYTILFGIIATAFYIYVPIHWAIYTTLLIPFSLLYILLLVELEDFFDNFFDKIEYLKNIVTLKNEITFSHNASSLHNPTNNEILHDQVKTITIKNTYLIWKCPIKNKNKMLSRYNLLSEQMGKLSPTLLDTTVLKEVKQEGKKYFFIFYHDIIRISYNISVDTIEKKRQISEGTLEWMPEWMPNNNIIIANRKQYSRLTNDLLNHTVKTLKNTPELEYLVRRSR